MRLYDSVKFETYLPEGVQVSSGSVRPVFLHLDQRRISSIRMTLNTPKKKKNNNKKTEPH